jgi:DNA-binding FrmR family transcriptional regulator
LLKNTTLSFDKYPHGVYYTIVWIPQGGIWKEIHMPENTNPAENKEESNIEESCTCCCSGKHKERDEKEFKDLMNRLKRIEGQVRGVEGMLENDAYCTDILIQVSAVTSALNSFNKALLANHMRTCVADNIRQGNDEVIDELVTALQKLMK